MNPRHKRALFRTALVLLASAYPLWFFYQHQRANVEPDITDFGAVPEFTLTFANQAGGFTHYQTLNQISVVAIVKDSCAASCPETVRYLQQFKEWADGELRLKTQKMSQPPAIRFVIQTAGAIDALPQDWSIVAMESGDPYLAPLNRANAPVPALVLIDDNGFYRAYESIDRPETDQILRRELSRMISQQFLLHYVNQQDLMWEKKKSQRASAP